MIGLMVVFAGVMIIKFFNSIQFKICIADQNQGQKIQQQVA